MVKSSTESGTGYGKLIASGGSGVIATAVIYFLQQRHMLPHQLDSESVAAIQALVTAFGVYLIPHDVLRKKRRNRNGHHPHRPERHLAHQAGHH
jgi:hypothetical protein